MADDKPQSMAGIGNHERVIEIARQYFPSNARVADLAAGQGAFSEMLVAEGYSVVAVDFNSDDWKSKSIPLRTQDLDSEFASSLLTDEAKFDAVVAIEIIEHLENPFRFVRECSKLLKPGGHLIITTPNVESVFSRLIFLYTGRLLSFSPYETVRPAHITPIFRWKLQMMCDEANIEIVNDLFIPLIHAPDTNIKAKIAQKVAGAMQVFVKGDKGAEGRILVGRLK